MRVGVYGGSFSPPHVGHALVAAWLRWADRVDEVWLVPAADHPFGKPLAPFSGRVEACRALAALVGPWVKVVPIEASLPAPSFTVNTLDALAAAHPEVSLRLVVGADVLADTPRWRAWDRIVAAYPPIVVGRAGFPDVPGAPTFPGVSSTGVRAALRAGEDLSHLVPPAVRAVVDTWPGGWADPA